ncbi:MAG: peptidylprolyl isomerase [Verrucomicrobiota bacterium]
MTHSFSRRASCRIGWSLLTTFSLVLTLFFPTAIRLQAAKPSEENLVTLKVVLKDESRKVLIQLDPEAAPRHVENFKKLIGEGFYNGQAFHRIIRGFIIQVGDPLSKDPLEKDNWGTGGPGHSIPAEIGLPHNRGSVAMARLHNNNPNKESNGSQFYFCLTPIPQLDKDYTVFGKVIEGMDVLDEMADSLTDSNDNPVRRIEIKTAALGDVGAIGSIAMPNPVAGTKKAIAAIPNPLNMFGGKKDADLSNEPAAYGDQTVPEGELPDVEYASEMTDIDSSPPIDSPEKEGFMSKLNPFNNSKKEQEVSPAPDEDAANEIAVAIDAVTASDTPSQEKEGLLSKVNPFSGEKDYGIPETPDPIPTPELTGPAANAPSEPAAPDDDKEGLLSKMNPFGGKKDYGIPKTPKPIPAPPEASPVADAPSDPAPPAENKGSFLSKMNPFSGKKDHGIPETPDPIPEPVAQLPVTPTPTPTPASVPGTLPDIEYASEMADLKATPPAEEKSGGFFSKLNPFGGKKDKKSGDSTSIDVAKAPSSEPADRDIPAPPPLPSDTSTAPQTTTDDSSSIPAEPLGGLEKISQLNFGTDGDDSTPKRKPKKTEAEKSGFTKFIERLW